MRERYQKRRRLMVERGQWRGCVPIVGTQRRLRSLAALGWSWRSLAAEAGMDERCVQRLAAADRPTVHPATHDRIVALFERLSMQVGPNRVARNYARRQGWPPPLAWYDVDLDDPAASPSVPTIGARELQPCGTEAAYRRHLRRGEQPCRACVAAQRVGVRERRSA